MRAIILHASFACCLVAIISNDHDLLQQGLDVENIGAVSGAISEPGTMESAGRRRWCSLSYCRRRRTRRRRRRTRRRRRRTRRRRRRTPTPRPTPRPTPVPTTDKAVAVTAAPPGLEVGSAVPERRVFLKSNRPNAPCATIGHPGRWGTL